MYRFFKAVVEAYPEPISFKKIKQRTLGLKGKHPTRDLRDRLPEELNPLVVSGKHGYSLKLPPTRNRS